MTALNSLFSTHQRSALPTLNHKRSVLQKLHDAVDRPVPPAAVVTLSPLASRDAQAAQPAEPSSGKTEPALQDSWDTDETQASTPSESAPPEAKTSERGSKAKGSKGQVSIDGLTKDQRDMVTELVQRDREVHTHEAAHQAAGAGLVGAASYTYQEGPDGRSYAIGGECPITIPASDNPSETIAIAQRVRSAALAPANPSGADMAVANAASQMEMQARQQLAQQQAEQQQAPAAPSTAQSAPPAESKDQSGETPTAVSKDPKGEPPGGGSPSTATSASTASRAMAAYARTSSAPARPSAVFQSSGL
jgi:hypothetical protein